MFLQLLRLLLAQATFDVGAHTLERLEIAALPRFDFQDVIVIRQAHDLADLAGLEFEGHIIAVGFDLYCQLLKQAVAQLKGDKLRPRLEVEVRLDFLAANEGEFLAAGPGKLVPAFIPTSYISDAALRIQAYRALAEITTQEQLHRLRRDWRDRFGPQPPAVDNLVLLCEVKLSAARARVSRVEVRDSKLMLSRRGDFILVGGKFPRLTSSSIDLQLSEIWHLIKQL